jgi:hypothetical protein
MIHDEATTICKFKHKDGRIVKVQFGANKDLYVSILVPDDDWKSLGKMTIKELDDWLRASD